MKKILIILFSFSFFHLFSQSENRKALNSLNSLLPNNKERACFLPKSTNVEIKTYNLQGEDIEIMIKEKKLKENHHFYYNTNTLNRGSCFCKVKTEKLTSIQRIIVMK